MTDATYDRDFGAKVQRDVMPTRGARFYREGDVLMFTFVIDTGNVIGPRPAVKADSEKHPGAWEEFVTAREPVVPETVDVVPDAIERDERPAVSLVEEKDMSGFAALIEPTEPVFVKYTGYTKLNISPAEEEAVPLSEVLAEDFAEHTAGPVDLKAALQPEPVPLPPKRKYTRKAAA